VVEEVQSTFRGMAIAIEADDWKPLALMSVVVFSAFLRDFLGSSLPDNTFVTLRGVVVRT
jgi:hypothetical protein